MPAVLADGTLADVEYDGTDMVLIDQLPPAIMGLAPAPIRQTVTAGPITPTGAAHLGGATGNTWVSCSSVSASYPLIVTAAAGWSAVNGLPIDIRGITTAPITWTGLTSNFCWRGGARVIRIERGERQSQPGEYDLYAQYCKIQCCGVDYRHVDGARRLCADKNTVVVSRHGKQRMVTKGE